jgi:hypothetical protein
VISKPLEFHGKMKSEHIIVKTAPIKNPEIIQGCL